MNISDAGHVLGLSVFDLNNDGKVNTLLLIISRKSLLLIIRKRKNILKGHYMRMNLNQVLLLMSHGFVI